MSPLGTRCPPSLSSALLLLTVVALAGCSSLRPDTDAAGLRRPPANDPVTGGSALLLSAARTTVFSTARQPISTARIGLKVLWHRPREVIAANLPFKINPTPPSLGAPGSEEFEQTLDARRFLTRRPGRLEWLVDGDEFFPELRRQIAAARNAIDFQIYIFDNDDIAVRYADLLKARSTEVPVRVLFDDLGSAFAHTRPPETASPAGFQTPADMAEYLRLDSEIQVRRLLNPWLVADHSKLIVFDHQTAFIGGMNIGREYYSEWHDLMVRVEGPVVGTLTNDFARTWRKAGPLGDLWLFRTQKEIPTPAAVPGQFPVRILRTDPGRGSYDILHSTLLAIRAARTRIWIQNPYVASEEIRRALTTAARRGVDVRLILPGSGDSGIMDAANLITAGQLITAGAKVYQYPRMTHMKVMIFDDWASMGSANLDTLSLRINRELNLAFNEAAEIRRLEQKIFLPDFRASRLLQIDETQSLVAPLTKIIADQL
jgi:cardiolipin synthase A/B